MYMWVVKNILAPGVQDGQEPDLGAEVLGVSGNSEQGLSS
jgi:hypothetical protein